MTDISPKGSPDGGEEASPEAGGFRWLGLGFALLLLIHVGLVLTNLRSGLLAGLEFRQAQTAISALFIQVENNFSLAYPTPVLGKPWSIPMEFPLYQWSTVWLSNATGWSLTVSARLLSALSFYAVLPALYRLLGQLGVVPYRRLMVLGVVLSSPLYIFYSRAFLIEAMALAFAAWFLAAFVEAMRRRSLFWLGLAVVCGTGGALVKVTTFIVWCIPAAIYGAVLLWRDWRSGPPHAAARTLGWGLACSVPALAAAWWWVGVSDKIKQLNAAGADLVSGRLAAYNFGNWSDRVSPEIWGRLFHQWNATVLPVWLAAGVLLLGALFLRAGWRPAMLALALFFAAQLVFPQLYSIHDYYFYAAGICLLVAVGSVPAGLMDSRLTRPLVWGVWLVLILGNLNHYRTGYCLSQKIVGVGGSGLTDAIRNTAPRDSVLIIMGDDWNSMIPYYAQRRALMIRRDLEPKWDYIDRAFADLRGEDIYALVVMGDQRNNRAFITRAVDRFKLDPEITYTFDGKADVYVRRFHRNQALRHMGSNEHPFYNKVVLAGVPDAPEGAQTEDGVDRTVHVAERTALFSEMKPAPVRYNFAFGPNRFELDGRPVVGAHPVSLLWFDPPPGERRLSFEFGMVAGAYAHAEGHTDGAEFTIAEQGPDGTERVIYQRRLDPFNVTGDQGLQQVNLSYTATAGAELVFRTGFGGGGSFDWCYWGKIRIE